ncbi:phage portal protein [Cyclobacterium amurskyense]|jgi:hypothetical protein|uniref:Uncharacterized protein n=1 Tax=Cyclobacterium amurskyense TaxID=320787 RepID=A0A0H4PEE0_9BACT|nr:hypothetical protein [Cyclobacterium amurskyense]AKP51460.1 hypothetical protein CA2015_2034 [Cyclobacterium amurskyense]|tara:strand:- start:514 stop:966 length:453 start_codon:yes stop_codon:yes gene_type:complete
MELKRIDNLWHFFATQNQLFLKKHIDNKVLYVFKKNKIQLIHSFNPRFTAQSSLSIGPESFEMGVETYAASKKRFGLPTALNLHQRLFFPKELLKLTSRYSLIIEKDRFKNLRVTLEPFIPKNIKDTSAPINLICETLWSFRYFSNTVKN